MECLGGFMSIQWKSIGASVVWLPNIFYVIPKIFFCVMQETKSPTGWNDIKAIMIFFFNFG